MDEDDLPDFLQLNGFRPRLGMFGAGRSPLPFSPTTPIPLFNVPAAFRGPDARPLPASPMSSRSIGLPQFRSRTTTPTAPETAVLPTTRARRSALTGLSVSKDQLEDWVRAINESGGLDEPEPDANTLNSDRDVARAIAHAATDKGGADTIEDLDLDDFVDRFHRAEGKLQLNGLQKGRRPEIFFTMGRDDRGQVVLRSLHAIGEQGQRAPIIPVDAIAIGHSHTIDIPAPPHAMLAISMPPGSRVS